MKAGKAIAICFFAMWAVGIGGFMILRPTFKHGKELLTAVQSGDTQSVRKLLDEGASLQVRDREGHTALWLAAEANHADIAEMLLSQGADPNARGIDGLTPLMKAVANGNTEAVRVLLAHGVNVNAVGLNGETALKLATTDRQKAAADLVRRAGGK